MKESRLLLIDDDPSLLRVTQFQLEEAGYTVTTASDGASGLQSFKENQPGLVISDIKMPGMDGLQLLAEIKRISPHALLVLITAHGSIETAIQAMKMGAYDYLCKPFEKEELLHTTRKALDYHHLMRENFHLHEELIGRYSMDHIVAGSEAMRKVFTILRRVSSTHSSVLLEGESGTGKELIARAIHYNSPRRKQPFVAVNCAAIPEQLMESEFFGHVKGSFTGALNDRIGKFEQASGGTIFLDEIGDMRLDLQSKLLRVLQEQEIEKVGGQRPIKVDVRVIAATNQNLKGMIEKGRFREDLYYRLNVVPIRLPALRERKDDIPLLAQHFLSELGGAGIHIDPEAFTRLQAHDWPGNVRELQNVIEQAFVLRQQDERIGAEDLPAYIAHQEHRHANGVLDIPPEGIVLDDVEKDLIRIALQKTKGNQNQAAKLLGITRQTLIYRMKKYEIS
ncbi:MAG: response regulator [bacterium]|nr:response regulator [bacterium]